MSKLNSYGTSELLLARVNGIIKHAGGDMLHAIELQYCFVNLTSVYKGD